MTNQSSADQNTKTFYDKIFIASDHAGFELKEQLKTSLTQLPWQDLGPIDTASVDYPDYANKVVQKVLATYANNERAIGVLICGSGQGMAIRANRNPKIRAALCLSEEMASLARAHNNANVLCLGAKLTNAKAARAILETFLKTNFEGGRHERRVAKLSEPS